MYVYNMANVYTCMIRINIFKGWFTVIICIKLYSYNEPMHFKKYSYQ